MGKAKAFGILVLVYAVGCVIINYFNGFLHLPTFGAFGSWVFNPLGMMLADTLTQAFIAGNPILWLGASGIKWAIGGVLSIIWVLILFFFGSLFVKH